MIKHQQNCPFCGGQASFYFADYENRKHFFCDNCTEFELSKYAEQLVSKTPADWADYCATSARNAPEGSYFVLTRPTADNLPGYARTELVGEYVRRKSD